MDGQLGGCLSKLMDRFMVTCVNGQLGMLIDGYVRG